MTNKEAINYLKLDINMMKFDPSTGNEAYLNDEAQKVIMAEEIAIKALEGQGDSDTINRQAAIEAIESFSYGGWVEESITELEHAINQVPPAPELIAHWRTHIRGQVRCSYCGKRAVHDVKTEYCPHCKAHMIERVNDDI